MRSSELLICLDVEEELGTGIRNSRRIITHKITYQIKQMLSARME
jgi:hypothetical protein